MQNIVLIRSVTMGVAGLGCCLYALLALVTARPDPMPIWIPGVLGIVTWGAICWAASRATPKARAAAFDEGHAQDNFRAQQVGFWGGLILYPMFGALLYLGAVDWPAAFAVMGTLTPGLYLISAVRFDLRGRGWG